MRRDLPVAVSITTTVITAVLCETIPTNDTRGVVPRSSRDAPEANPDIILSDCLCSITDKPFPPLSLALSFARSY